ncbi:MAG: ferredoxin [Polyangiaceae bacterium]
MSGKIARIVIDADKCIGSDACVAVAPKTFKVDPETNVAVVIDPHGDPFEYQMTAAADCPPEAISFFDHEGHPIDIDIDAIDFPKDASH